MLHIALLEPEIAPNTGNIARLCAATGARLHLIGRLGFHIDDRHLRRAGLDYWQHVDRQRHDTFDAFRADLLGSCRFHCFSAHATRAYTAAEFRDGDCLLFGNESQGLPASFLETHADCAWTIPMPTGNVRSLNLATAVGIVLYEAIRQLPARS